LGGQEGESLPDPLLQSAWAKGFNSKVMRVLIDRRWRWGMAMALVAALSGSSTAQDENEEQPYLPGLPASYADADRREARRLDDAIAFDWGRGLPDQRLRQAPFTARWRGLLWVRDTGDYRLHVFATGEVEIRLAGQTVIARQQLKEAWAVSDPLPLAFDRHPLEVDFRQTEPSARIALFWSGPQFSLEPIPPRHLMHDRKETIAGDFERGRLLAAALRCAACHGGVDSNGAAMPAPSLTNLGGNLRPDWLSGWLMDAGHASAGEDSTPDKATPPVVRRMPAFGLSRDDAAAITAYLVPPMKAPSLEPKVPATNGKRSKGATGKKKEDEPASPNAKQGERLFLTMGCLACHQLGPLGESGLFGGGDLTAVANKRPTEFFARWLADPAAINRQHRMPVFDLTADERTSLSLFLAQQSKRSAPIAKAADSKLASRGRELVEKHRCGACHELPGMPARPALIANVKLDGRRDWSRSCSGSLAQSKTGLGYGLSRQQQQELQTYFQASQSGDSDRSKADGATLLVANNCLACHARDGFTAARSALPAMLADKLAAVGQAHYELAPLIPAMTPPSLNSIGDKLHDAALAAAIRRSGAAYRSYLLVRMPKFRLSDEELAAITAYFVTGDRIPPGGTAIPSPPTVQESAFTAAGGRLVSTDGFSCVSCHQVGSVVPDKAPLNARGPGLSQIDKRIRREWFDRFVADPSRIVPRMEMPSVRVPVKGVLGDKVDAQLAAVWHVVNTPGFEPPEPNPVRVLRTSGIAERKEPPIVINDVVKIGQRTFVQPLVIGLPNRQNFLFDLGDGRLAAWWLGDVARQRTKGKSWNWEPGGPLVMPATGQSPEFAIVRRGKRMVPSREGQHIAKLLDYSASDRDISFYYELQLTDPDNAAAPAILVRVSDRWNVDGTAPLTGCVREFSPAWKIEEGDQIEIRPRPAELSDVIVVGNDRQDQRLPATAAGGILIHRASPEWTLRDDGAIVSRPLQEGRRINAGTALMLAYRSKLPADTSDAAEVSIPADVGTVEIAPGLVGRRLPLPMDLMPTALAWHNPRIGEASQLYVGSLKGQVITARDTDDDGLEDSATTFADGLAAPYGIHDGGPSLHVLTKSALLEVWDGKVQVLASGWGHTDDYHDWAVGLPRNERGEYFIGLPCQQDERSAAAAKYRGTVLKLTPRMPTDDNPLRYDLNVVSTGHRFPMGLALDRAGELFVTDNQGNYNPFNELNHVRPGAFFGFINANEKKDNSFQAPPLIEPAIDIPHPWTRSVNGICFLHTPEPLRKEGQTIFGPLEGHLIGCEYDTRRLVRMTLQKVGDTYQGAAYPLSLEPSSPDKGFLGPVVCAVSPRGELYVGSMRDSGWGAGNNIGEVVQVKIEPDKLLAGIAEMRAVAGGFAIDFFRPVDAAKAANAANYSLSSYRRESTPAYGGPDLDRRIERIAGIEVAPDCRRVILKLAELREGFVYELQVKNLTADGSLFHPDEAHYTLRKKAE
jgi:mono/diheme cytochrome c family protein